MQTPPATTADGRGYVAPTHTSLSKNPIYNCYTCTVARLLVLMTL